MPRDLPRRSQWLMACLFGLLSATPAAGVEPVREYRPGSYENVQYPGAEDERSASPAVNERPLWQAYERRDRRELQTLLAKYRGWYPRWQPPVEIQIALLQNAQREYPDRDSASRVVQLAQERPREFTCEKTHNRWSLADAYAALGDRAALENEYRRILTDCRDPAQRRITLQRVAQQLPLARGEPLLRIAVPQVPTDGHSKQAEYTAFYATHLGLALSRRDRAAGDAAAAYLAPRIARREDAQTAALLGWWALQNDDATAAADWFTSALRWQASGNVAYGLGLSWRRLGRQEALMPLVHEWRDREPRMRELLLPARRASGLASGHDESIATSRRGTRVSEAWRLYRQQQFAASQRRFATLYRERGDPDSAKGLVLAAIGAGDLDAVLRLARTRAGALQSLRSDTMPAEANARERYYWFYTAAAGAAQRRGDHAQSLAILQRLEPEIQRRRDAASARLAGWVYLKYEHAAAARTWFQRALHWREDADAARGYALALRASGDPEAAWQFLQPWVVRTPTLRDLNAEFLLDRADRRYADGDYRTSLALAEESDRLRPARRARARSAWSLYRLGEVRRAAQTFESLYAEAPDAGVADGLIATASALRDDRRLQPIAATLGGPLVPKLHDTLAQRYYDQDLFILADRTRNTTHAQLENVDSLSSAALPYGRSRSGDSGLSELRMYGVDLEAQGGIGLHRFKFDVDVLQLDSGALDTRALFGLRSAALNFDVNRNRTVSGPFRDATFERGQFDATILDADRLPAGRFSAATLAASRLAPEAERQALIRTIAATGDAWVTHADGLVEPLLSYRYEHTLSPYVAIGTTPIGGVGYPLPVGRLGLDWRHAEGALDAQVFAESRQDSLLSTSGLLEPWSGRRYGRVVEYGLRGSAWQQLAGPWSVSAAASISRLTGESVADNERYAAGLGLGYALGLRGFDYFNVGPAYRYEHYRANRRFFTFGHGGYFSPDQLHRIGAAVDFQTAEGSSRFVLRGRGFLGYQHTDEDAFLPFPLAPPGLQFFPLGNDRVLALHNQLIGGGTQSGAAFDADLSGVYRLNAQVQLGGFVRAIQTENFTDVGGGLMLRVLFDPRPAVFSTDLPRASWPL